MHSSLPSEHSRLRLLAEQCLGFVMVVLFLRTWYLEGLVIPVKVNGGSMADTLLGVHREVTCADCGYRFVCGTDLEPVSERAVCPNCGYAENDLYLRPDLDGDRVLVHKSVLRLRSPKRWEVVAFRRPGRADRVLVKRVVGLPHESVRIEKGNVYVDGQVQRKGLAQQQAMAVLVHDSSFQPILDPLPPPRWRFGPDSQWGSNGGRFAHSSTAEDEPIDWLVYHHWRRVAGAAGDDPESLVVESPVTDLCGYNQSRPRREEHVNAVTDLMLSMRLVETRGQGLLVIRATDGRDEFDVRLDPVRHRYEILQNGRPVPASIGRIPSWDGELEIEFSLFDHQVLLAFNGETRARWPYEPAPTPPKPTAQPLAIGAQGLGVLIREVRVYRDVYYTRPSFADGRSGRDEPVQLGEDQYYVLGDNSPISDDSRTWPEGTAVPARLVVGKPLFVHFPAPRARIGNWVFQVPDPARIRYIR